MFCQKDVALLNVRSKFDLNIHAQQLALRAVGEEALGSTPIGAI